MPEPRHILGLRHIFHLAVAGLLASVMTGCDVVGRYAIDMKARTALNRQIKPHAHDNALRTRLSSSVTDTAAAARLRHDLDIHALLLSHSDAAMAARIGDYYSVDGPQLVQRQDDAFAVWQADLRQTDTLRLILSAIDPVSKLQICATLDEKNKDLVLHFAGTDMANSYDLATAITVATGGVSRRAGDGAVYADSVATRLRRLYPDFVPADYAVGIVAHSQGAAAVPAATVRLAARGFAVDRVFILDPFGAKKVYGRVARILKLPEETLARNVTTVTSLDPGLLGTFKKASRPVGTLEPSGAENHHLKSFIGTFNAERAATAPQGPK